MKNQTQIKEEWIRQQQQQQQQLNELHELNVVDMRVLR